ncbi:MAG: tetratricopeptide repeat protein [Bacteroidota bacterium]
MRLDTLSKVFLFILLSIVTQLSVKADFASQIDSLTVALQNATPAEKPALYNLIAWKIRNSNPEDSYEMAIRGFNLSSKLNNMRQLAFSHNILGLYHSYQNNTDSALYYFNKQIMIAHENGLDAFEAYAYQNIGSLYYRRALFDAALKNYESTEKVYQRIGSMSNLAKAKTNIGLVHFEKGNYSKALNYYHQAQDIYRDSITNKEGLGALLNNMGDVLFELLDFDRALNYYQESIAINKIRNDFRRLCTSLRLAGKTHAMLGGYQEAEINLNDALNYARRLNDPVAILECVKEKARLYFLTENFQMARGIVDDHTQLMDSVKSDILKAEVFLLIGKVDLKENRYQAAEANFMKALKCAMKKVH